MSNPLLGVNNFLLVISGSNNNHSNMSQTTKPYRKNVGIVVFNADGQVLAGERIGYENFYQFPQGGLEAGELPLEGAWRELEEETGICLKGVKPVAELKKWLTYEFPQQIPDYLKIYRGQRQKWFFFYWDGELSSLRPACNAETEFRQLKWADIGKIAADIVAFKRDVYRVVRSEGEKIIRQYLKEQSGAGYQPL